MENKPLKNSLILGFLNRLYGDLARNLPFAIGEINSNQGSNTSFATKINFTHLPPGFRHFLQTSSSAEALGEFIGTLRASRPFLYLTYPHLWEEIINTLHTLQSPDRARQLYFLAFDWLERNDFFTYLKLVETELPLLVKFSQLRPPDDLAPCQKEKARQAWKKQILMAEMLSGKQPGPHWKPVSLTNFSRKRYGITEQSVIGLYQVLYGLTDDPEEKLQCVQKALFYFDIFPETRSEQTDWIERHLREYPGHTVRLRQTCLTAIRHGVCAGERASGWIGLCLIGADGHESELYDLLQSRLQDIVSKLPPCSPKTDERRVSIRHRLPPDIWRELKAMSGWRPLEPSLHDKVRHLWWDSISSSFPEKYSLLSRLEDDEYKLLKTACSAIPPCDFYLVLAEWSPRSPQVRQWVLENMDYMRLSNLQEHFPTSLWRFLFSPHSPGHHAVSRVGEALFYLPQEEENPLFNLVPFLRFPSDTFPHLVRLLAEELAEGIHQRQEDVWDTVSVAFFLLTEYFRLEKDRFEKRHSGSGRQGRETELSSELEEEYTWLGRLIGDICFCEEASLYFFEKTVQWAMDPNLSVSGPHLAMTLEIVLETASFELAQACNQQRANNEKIFRYLRGLTNLIVRKPTLVAGHRDLIFHEFWPQLCQIVKETSHPVVFWAAGMLGNELAEWQDASRLLEWWEALTHRPRDIFLSTPLSHINRLDPPEPDRPSDVVDTGYPETVNLSHLIRLDFLTARVRFALESIADLFPSLFSGISFGASDEVTVIRQIRQLMRIFPEPPSECQSGWNSIWEHLRDFFRPTVFLPDSGQNVLPPVLCPSREIIFVTHSPTTRDLRTGTEGPGLTEHPGRSSTLKFFQNNHPGTCL